jgi:hypothetical protein
LGFALVAGFGVVVARAVEGAFAGTFFGVGLVVGAVEEGFEAGAAEADGFGAADFAFGDGHAEEFAGDLGEVELFLQVGEDFDGGVEDGLGADFLDQLFVFFGVNFGGVGDFAVDELGLDGGLEALQATEFVGVDQGDGFAFLAGAAGAADAVDVALLVEGHVVVEDVGDAGDVEAAGGDVGGDEHFEAAFLEGADGVLALVLFDVAVEGFGGAATGEEGVAEFVGFPLGAAEEDGFFRFLGINDADNGVEAFLLVDHVEGLFDVGVGGVVLDEVDGDGGFENVVGEFADWGGHGGGEEEGLAFLGEVGEDFLDVFEEAHVEHFVGFIKDDHGRGKVAEALGFEEVEQAAGGGDDDVGAAVDEFDLAGGGLAAVDGDGADFGEAAEAEEFVGDLAGEFAGGGDDENFDGVVVFEHGHGGQAEGGGLAGAGAGLGDEVFAGEDDGDGGGLDGGGGFVAGGDGAGEDLRGEVEVGEGLLGEGGFGFHGGGGVGGGGGFHRRSPVRRRDN